jgi:TRAP-type C4-dicarboxylate transport system permease small subunit
LFGTLVPSASELRGYLVVASTFLGLAPTLRSGGHIRVELFASRLGPRARRWLEVWCLAAGLVLIGFLAYASIELVMNSFTYHVTSSGLLPVPLWIPQASMVLGLVMMAVALFELLVHTLAGHQPSYRDPSLDVVDQEGQL